MAQNGWKGPKAWPAAALGWWVLLGLFPAPLEALTTAPKRQLARQQFERAEQARAELAAKPEKERRPADYQAALRAYQQVVHLAPTLRQAPESLFRSAELYREMARQFREDKNAEKYSAAARKQYEFLLKEYPENRFVNQARKALAELAEAEASRPTTSRLTPLAGTSAGAGPDASGGRGQPVLISTLRQWSTPNYTRLVIDLDDTVEYEAGRLSNPDRIFFDLHNTHLASSVGSRSLAVSDGLLKRIRLGKYRPLVTRIVLEVEQIGNYSAFLLPNPYRLVIDIHGESKARSALGAGAGKTEPKPAQPEPSATEVKPPPQKTEPAGTKPVPLRPPPDVAAAPPAATEAAEPRREPAESKKEELVATNVVPSTSGPTSKPVYESVRPARPARDGHRSLTRTLGLKIGRIVLDPGHGGHDTGTVGPTGFTEKELVLDVSKRLGALLEKRLGGEVVYTREDDSFVPLETRTGVANQKQADLFVSVHANASRSPRARGVETYYLSFTTAPEALEVAARENAVSEKSIHELQDLVKKITLYEKVDESREFAAEVQRSLHSGMARGNSGLRNRGVKKAPFIVLIGANMPSILAEISFVSNPHDERLLKKPEYRQRVAEALFRGIQRYAASLGGVKVASKTPGQLPTN